MADKTKIADFDQTAANNVLINSISAAEGMAPSLVNNLIRGILANLADAYAGDQAWDSLTAAITSGSTQSQAGATQLNTIINQVTVSGTDGDGVKLPPAVAGTFCIIANDDAAQTIQVWPATDDSVDSEAANAVDPNTIPAGGARMYYSLTGVIWKTLFDQRDAVSTATSSSEGVVELSSDAETVTGSDTARATTPANITAKMAAPGAIGGTTPAAANFTTVDGTGDISGANFVADGDTAAADLANVGYAAADGLKLTGQGSTRDISLYNDADVLVMGVLTGTTTAAFEGEVTGTGFTGTLDGILGGGTPAAVTGTTGTFSGVLSVDDTTDSSSATTGSIHTDGGLGVAKDIFSGGKIIVAAGTVSDCSIASAAQTNGGLYFPETGALAYSYAGTEYARLFGSVLYWSDTANTNMSTGITINQAGGDNEIFALKSSDVAHGHTSWSETDTYFSLAKGSAAVGGVKAYVIAEEIGSPWKMFVGSKSEITTKATNSDGRVHFISSQIDGANGYDTPSANSNIFCLGTTTSGGSFQTQWIVDTEGDTHANGTHNDGVFDSEDDAMMCRAFDLMRAPDNIIKSEFDQWAGNHKQSLIDAGIITYVDPDDPESYYKEGDLKGQLAKPLLNTSQLQRLHNGAIWQQRAMFETMKKTLDEIIPGFGMKLANALKAQKLPALPV